MPRKSLGTALWLGIEHSEAQALDLSQAPLHAPSPLCPPLLVHVDEPVAHDGVAAGSPLTGAAAVVAGAAGSSQLSVSRRDQRDDTNDLAALKCMTAEIAELARSEPQDSWIGTRLNFHHFDIQSWLFARVRLNFHNFDIHNRNQDIWLAFVRDTVTAVVSPRCLFGFLTTLTFGALRKNHIVSTASGTIAKKGRFDVHVRSELYHELSRTQPKLGGRFRGKKTRCHVQSAHVNFFLTLSSASKAQGCVKGSFA